jgi:hypothetical protein
MLAGSIISGAAGAAVIYNNPAANNGNANCAFSTACAVFIGAGDDYAAQRFPVGAAADVTTVDYTIIQFAPSDPQRPRTGRSLRQMAREARQERLLRRVWRGLRRLTAGVSGAAHSPATTI